jgi:predicted MFS family arabinose efflux permease
MISFQTLLPVVPVLLERSGPHGAAGAGTAALFIGTVAGELVTPWVMSFWSPKRLLIGGQLLIAVPSLVYLFPDAPAAPMLAAAAVRGFGTGVAIVVCIALLAELAPPNRRGRSIGYFGLATGVPSIVFPSIGVTLLADGHGGVAAVIAFMSGLGATLLALRLPSRSAAEIGVATNMLAEIRRPRLLAMFVGFALVSCTFGGVITYTPVALPSTGVGSAAVFLIVSGAARAGGRWASGVIGDHRPIRLVLTGGLALMAVGLIALAVRGSPITVLIAATTYGMGYGAIQTGSYLALVARSGRSDWAVTSALWNSAIDIGASAGGIMVGLSAAVYGYATAVWVMPIVLMMSLPLLWSAGRSTESTAEESAKPSGEVEPAKP